MGKFKVNQMRYTESHEWVKLDGEIATVGITDYAQKELGNIVYVELPIEGYPIHKGEEVVVLESTKAAVDIYTPIGGEILAINTSLREFPEKVNHSAEKEGWLFKIQVSDPQELETLMDKSAYHAYTH